jgi:hypothetical protein
VECCVHERMRARLSARSCVPSAVCEGKAVHATPYRGKEASATKCGANDCHKKTDAPKHNVRRTRCLTHLYTALRLASALRSACTPRFPFSTREPSLYQKKSQNINKILRCTGLSDPLKPEGYHGPCGLMDKASDFGSGDCAFESRQRYILIFWWQNRRVFF